MGYPNFPETKKHTRGTIAGSGKAAHSTWKREKITSSPRPQRHPTCCVHRVHHAEKGVWNQERCGFTRLYPSKVQLLRQENGCFSAHNWWLMILHDGHKPHQPGEQQSLTSPSNQTFKSHQKMQSMTNQRMNFSEIWLISIYHGISRLYHGKSG